MWHVGPSMTMDVPVFDASASTVQQETIVELQATKKIYQQTLITERYKLVVYRDQSYGELYDLQLDPDQYCNLWGQPEAAARQSELLHRFVQCNMRREGHVHDRKAFA